MTRILTSERHRNEADNCTLIVQRYQDKGDVPLWRILYRFDYSPSIAFRTFKAALTNRPSRERVSRLLAAL